MRASAGSAMSDAMPGGAVVGRRRAKLVARMDASAPTLSLADVQALKSSRSPEARAAVAAKFGRQYDRLIEADTRSLADAVLALLVRDVEASVRQALTEAIAASPNLPPAIANRLARDTIEVARPVLEQSPVLSDEDLAEIVRTHAMQYALAVAGREHLTEHLCDVLADTGEGEVVARLVGNNGAQISARTLGRIAADYRAHHAVHERLVRRPALPYELVEQLVGEIGERLEWELTRNRRLSTEEARQLVAAARDRATLSMVAREHGERTLERELRHRHTVGELQPEDILAFLRDGEIARVEAGLALLADTDLARTRRLLYGMDKRGLAALCARAGFGTPHYLTLRMALDLAEQAVKGSGAGEAYSSETMQFVQDQYERIRADRDKIEVWFRH